MLLASVVRQHHADLHGRNIGVNYSATPGDRMPVKIIGSIDDLLLSINMANAMARKEVLHHYPVPCQIQKIHRWHHAHRPERLRADATVISTRFFANEIDNIKEVAT